MAFVVNISNTAERNLGDIVNYLKDTWSPRVANKFIQTFEDKISFIAERPEMYPLSVVKQGLRRCVITKHCSCYYTIGQETVEIVTIQDNRRDPLKP